MTFLNQWGKLLTSMIKTLLQTDSDYVYTFLRIIAGIIVFPYGMQKLFGWFSAPGFGAAGIKGSLEQLAARNIPKFIAWLIIIGQWCAINGLLADKMTTCAPITKIREFPSLVHCGGE